MEVVDPPGIPVNTKRVSPKRKKARYGIGAQNKNPEHASYAAAIINAPSLPLEVTPRT